MFNLFSRCDGHEGGDFFSGRVNELLDAVSNHRIVLSEPHRTTSPRVVKLRDVVVRVELAFFAPAMKFGAEASNS
jgi:hypothetical protein